MKKLDWLHWALLATAGLMAFFLWMSPHRYEHLAGGLLIRIHRITGKAERLQYSGWIPMQPRDRVADTLREVYSDLAGMNDAELSEYMESKFPGYRNRRSAKGGTIQRIVADPDFRGLSPKDKAKVLDSFFVNTSP